MDRVAARLLHLGVGAGDRVAIMAATSFGWALAEWAIWRAGAVVVPIHHTSPAHAVGDALGQTAAVALFVDAAAEQAAAAAAPSIPLLRIPADGDPSTEVGTEPTERDLEEMDSRRPRRDDVCSIVFTSGSSAEPRGTLIAHRNLIDLALNVQAAWADVLTERGSTVIFLPLSHILARGLQAVYLWAGMRVSYVSEPAQVLDALPRLQPTFLVVVPRILEKVRDAVRAKAARSGLGRLWEDAEQVAIAWGRVAEEADAVGRTATAVLPSFLRLRHAMYQRVFYRKVVRLFGDKIEFLLSGAAPLEPALSLMFRGMGMPVMEGYGLTETTAPATGNRPGRIRSGTVGEPVPGTSIRIGDDDVVWVKGIGVSPGYLGEHPATDDGWLNTGDLGRLDEGYLTITGRLKEVVVTSGGKTVSPTRWAREVESDPRVAHAIVVGDKQPYLSAVLLLDETAVAESLGPDGTDRGGNANGNGDGDLRVVPEGPLHAQLAALVRRANQKVARSESIKKFRAVAVDLSPGAGWVTPTLNLQRHVALERLAHLTKSLYER